MTMNSLQLTANFVLLAIRLTLSQDASFTQSNCTSRRLSCSISPPKLNGLTLTELINARPYSRVCRFGGRLYQLGWSIKPVDNPCFECTCNEFWNDQDPFNSLACRKIDCKTQEQIDDNCRPVYKEGICCPVDFHCGPQCVFNGTRFRIGTSLVVSGFGADSSCLDCQCTAPPHFTCKQLECPPPDKDLDNCRAVKNETSCCPSYECDKPERLSNCAGYEWFC